jgi:hypothetical protein
VTIEQALAVQKTLDAIYRSAREGREIRMTVGIGGRDEKVPVAVQLYSVRDEWKRISSAYWRRQGQGFDGVEFADITAIPRRSQDAA